MDMNDFIMAFVSGGYAVALFYIGRLIWWPKGSLMEAIGAIKINKKWKIYGLMLSILPGAESFFNIDTGSSRDLFVYVLGGLLSYYFFRDDFQENPYPETQFKMNLGFLYVLIAPAFACFASYGFLDIFGWLPEERTDLFISGLILLSPIVFVCASLMFYFEKGGKQS